MNIFNKWLVFFFVSRKTQLVKVVYFDGMLSQPMPYEAAVWPAKTFGGIIVQIKRKILNG
jgi:hypothetical protein